MSLRLFIYYCAICGWAAALLGWGAGRVLAPADDGAFFKTVVYAIFLGLTVAAGLGLVDGLWSYSGRFNQQVLLRFGVGVLVGAVAGAIGGIVGQFLFSIHSVFLIVGWVLTGLLVGASVGVYDIALRLIRNENLSSAVRKVVNGAIGGAIGGFLGGILHMILAGGLSEIFAGKDDLLSPSAVAFAALGTCVGLLIGLALVIFKQAWIKVESGFRPGRELIVSKPEIKIGKGEECEVGLYGGAGVERIHARINQRGLDYYLSDAMTDGGTFLNEKQIKTPTMLRSGDRIRVGNCVLLFQERRKGQRK